MNNIGIFDHYKRIGKVIAMVFPPFVEVVIHDLRQPKSSIIAIFNSHVTGRKVGDRATNLGYQRIDGNMPDELINYKNESPDGKPLRSTSIAIRNENNDLIGSFCLNIDISLFSQISEFMELLTQTEVNSNIIERENFLYSSPKKEIQKQINQFISGHFLIGKQLNRQHKINIVKQLYYSGAFNNRGSISIVSKSLLLTRQTIYNYLNNIKNGVKSKRKGVLL